MLEDARRRIGGQGVEDVADAEIGPIAVEAPGKTEPDVEQALLLSIVLSGLARLGKGGRPSFGRGPVILFVAVNFPWVAAGVLAEEEELEEGADRGEGIADLGRVGDVAAVRTFAKDADQVPSSRSRAARPTTFASPVSARQVSAPNTAVIASTRRLVASFAATATRSSAEPSSPRRSLPSRTRRASSASTARANTSWAPRTRDSFNLSSQ